MNPRLLEPYIEANRQRQINDDWGRWMLGKYVRDAVQNAMNGRKSKYPEVPYMQEYENKRIIDGSNLSEEEQEMERKKIMAAMGFSE